MFVLEFVCVTLEAPRRATLGTRLKFDRAGAVRAVVVQGPEAKSTMPVAEYTLPGFEPPLVRVGRETGATTTSAGLNGLTTWSPAPMRSPVSTAGFAVHRLLL
ncbi:hypothetical protein [Burkholderia anthina]|uniref:hypothetical protein n=1 Tax=Burkholderia anthina TaxID=179879 RepID=UPI001FC892CD|nr:hypothetical protein [Burkholderia anthina]